MIYSWVFIRWNFCPVFSLIGLLTVLHSGIFQKGYKVDFFLLQLIFVNFCGLYIYFLHCILNGLLDIQSDWYFSTHTQCKMWSSKYYTFTQSIENDQIQTWYNTQGDQTKACEPHVALSHLMCCLCRTWVWRESIKPSLQLGSGKKNILKKTSL